MNAVTEKISESHRLPAEFEKHSCTYLFWPVRPDNWRHNAKIAQARILELAYQISRFEPVKLGIHPTSEPPDHIPNNCQWFQILYDDIWVRDTGPVILTSESESPIAIDWQFNSWGGLFNAFDSDDAVASKIATKESIPVIRSPTVVEPGAFITDGRGTLIITEESILNKNRNPNLNKEQAEAILSQYLKVSNIIWIPKGLKNDEAGGHIDNVCAFAPNNTLLIAATSNPSHPSFEALDIAWKILSKEKNAQGALFNCVKLDLPSVPAISDEEAVGFASPDGVISRTAGTPMAASYLNLFVTNGSVIVPTYGLESDTKAMRIISKAFPGRETIGFPSREFLLGGGAIHCLTRDLPILN